MKVAVLGAGYVGLVSAAGYAETGNRVWCTDLDPSKIDALSQGMTPFFEPGLRKLIKRNERAGRLSFHHSMLEAVADAEVVFLAVGTPARDDGSADLSALHAALNQLIELAPPSAVIAIKSTVPAGTHRSLQAFYEQRLGNRSLISNPEFLREGDAIADFLKPARMVFGCLHEDKIGRERMERLHRPMSLDRERMIFTDPASAELSKYACNAMLATRVAFMNELVGTAEKSGADIETIRQIMGQDSRIGPSYLQPGPGFGGACLPKDLLALIASAEALSESALVLRAVSVSNREHRLRPLRQLQAFFEHDLKGKRIAVWGLSFKERTDDIRESAAIELIHALIREGATLFVHDPAAMENVRKTFGTGIQYADDPYDAVNNADALVLMTSWREYRQPDFLELKQRMRGSLLVDSRNAWSSFSPHEQGFDYCGMGFMKAPLVEAGERPT